MSSTRIWYSVGRHHDDRFEITINWACELAETGDARNAAEEAADDFHSNHDGWESVWPIEFRLYHDKDGSPAATLDVERDVEPGFSARHAKVKP